MIFEGFVVWKDDRLEDLSRQWDSTRDRREDEEDGREVERGTATINHLCEKEDQGKRRGRKDEVKNKLSSFEGFVLKDFDEGRECLHVIKQLCAGCKREWRIECECDKQRERERKRKERLTRRHIDEAFDGGFLESVKLFLADGEKEEILKDFDQSIRGKCRPGAVSVLSQTKGIEKKRGEGRERQTFQSWRVRWSWEDWHPQEGRDVL